MSAPIITLSDYLERQSGTTFKKLYQQPSTAFAIFRRMLPSLAKTFVMALLYMPKPLSLADLDTWAKPDARKQKDHALAILRVLHIVLITAPSREKPQEVSLTPNFKKSLRLALEGGGSSHNTFGVPSSLPVPPNVDIPFLDKFARTRWDAILHYVVNSVEGDEFAQRPSKRLHSGGSKLQDTVKELLVAGGLVERRGGSISISKTGFTFLLQESNAQVWTLLLQWLEAVNAAGGDHSAMAVDMLSFLFMLGTLELGQAYDTEELSEQRRNMLPSLVDFGLVYIPPGNTSQYFPTRLATTLTSGSSALRSASSALAAATAEGPNASGGGQGEATKGSIIIETNYRLYAYTSTPLQIAILGLFAELRFRFAGMVTGRLDRESIKRAISYGITADQVIEYLAAHAHEQMHRTATLRKKPVLPPTVVDQIRLWQLETERMKIMRGFLFRDFDSQAEYDDLAKYADEIGVLLWRSDARQLFFASKVDQLSVFLKARKKAAQ
ncbi:hypothetical protein RB595_005739 [Gaeumannomyces hyphopodioides]